MKKLTEFSKDTHNIDLGFGLGVVVTIAFLELLNFSRVSKIITLVCGVSIYIFSMVMLDKLRKAKK